MVDKQYTIRTRKRGRNLNARSHEDEATMNDFSTARLMQHPELASDVLQYYPHIVTIGYGCLLIPAIFLAWWYWTKRTARRVVHGVITFTHRDRSSTSPPASPFDATTLICSGDDDVDRGPYFHGCTTHASSPKSQQPNESTDYYQSWDDSLPKGKKFRFVHWMNRTKTSRTRQTVHTTTLHNLRNNTIEETVMSPKYTGVTEAVPCDVDGNDAYRKMGSAPNIVTHIQAPNNPTTHTGIEMFVIEYPQQMSHPYTNTISMI